LPAFVPLRNTTTAVCSHSGRMHKVLTTPCGLSQMQGFQGLSQAMPHAMPKPYGHDGQCHLCGETPSSEPERLSSVNQNLIRLWRNCTQGNTLGLRQALQGDCKLHHPTCMVRHAGFASCTTQLGHAGCMLSQPTALSPTDSAKLHLRHGPCLSALYNLQIVSVTERFTYIHRMTHTLTHTM
jgi:hypothetical protein